MSTKIMILGGSGYLGTAFREHLDSICVDYLSVGRSTCNYYDAHQLNELVELVRPEFLINAAGFTGKPNVDACEQRKAECLWANAVLPGAIRDVCENRGLPWGHVSSGCIFLGEGSRGHGFTEDEAPNFSFRHNNCSFYAGSKALGEELIGDSANCFIWRIRMPFNHVDTPRNLLSKLARYQRLVEARNSLSHLGECVAAAIDCWRRRLPFGVYHLTNPGSMTTREIAILLARHSVRTWNAIEFFEDD